jgi:NAD(P)-dependent dehydrogenase (short-subunit alcohol dehydrogenase family)
MPTLLITGANRGIGLEFARQYTADGWDVIACVRDAAGAGDLQSLGVRIEQADMRDVDAVVAFARTVNAPLDLLIANAGTWSPETIDTPEDGRAWAEMLTVNAIAPVLLARALLPQLAAAGGKLIAITSRMGSIADNSSGGHISYRASKAALNMAWHSLAIEWGSRGIVAAVLNPGWVKTRMGGPNAPTPPEQSVAAMRRVIDRLTPEQSGGFFNHDGEPIPW